MISLQLHLDDYIHYDCIEGDKWLVNWLGFEVKEMEENDD